VGSKDIPSAPPVQYLSANVSKYEMGQRRLDLVELRELCSVLGITLGTLVRRCERSLD